MGQLFRSREERVRREAAAWIGRLNGPTGDDDRAAFERWYSDRPEHARTYDRMSALFVAAGEVPWRRSHLAAAPASGAASRRPIRLAVAGAALALALIVAGGLFAARNMLFTSAPSTRIASVAAGAAESRQALLADGSRVLLAPGSVISIVFTGAERRLRLLRGEARFTVAHEARPFVVDAGGSKIVAHGTVFLVRVGGGSTTVALLQGSIDVAYPVADGTTEPRVSRLRPGETIVIRPGRATGAASPPGPPSPAPAAMLEFDDTPLSEAIAHANAAGGAKIALGDPDLATLRVTGAFRRGEPAALARSLAAAFHLKVTSGTAGAFLLVRPAGAP